MRKIYTITKIKNNFLEIINNFQDDILITKNYAPVAEIKRAPFAESEKGAISLIILGSRECSEQTAASAIKTYNKLSKKFKNIIFVYGKETEKFINEFKCPNLTFCFNEKTSQPIITALKKGVSGLTNNEKYFIVTFLNQNITRALFMKIINAALKNNDLNKNIFIPVVNGCPEHPIAFSKKYITKIIKTRKELGLPYILKKFKNDILFIAKNI